MDKLSIIERHIEVIREIEAVTNGNRLKTIHFYRDIAQKFNAYKHTGENRTSCVTWVADDFRICERTVWKALKFFEL